MAKRNYNKKSEYWGKFEKDKPPILSVSNASSSPFSPELCGDPFYTSTASYTDVSKAYTSRTPSGVTGSKKRINRSAVSTTADRYGSIRSGMLPYNYSSDGVDVRDAIELCQKAYANVAIFRNAIDIMSEFANTEIFLQGGTAKSRSFFESWLKRINVWNLKDQFFREYYRGGNIFLYRVDGKFTVEDLAQLASAISPKSEISNNIPIKYIMLNPYDILAKNASSFTTGSYEKILSEYEISKLKTPINQEDKDIYEGLDEDVKKAIKSGAYQKEGVKIKIDPTKLYCSFYKKQDYEPFAIPFGYPVLEDINAKLELKKMDQAITRTVENVVLLITMGAEPDKGGINSQNLNAMQNLFKNESVGRVLVSDYTTKANFIIPDLNKVLGKEKYEILNEDIKQGLQNIIVGEEKYSATEVKAKIFTDRLKEARLAFLNDFLQKEIKRISQDMGFRSYPTAVFKDLDMRDETQLMRVSTRLMELGVLTPQQGMEMFHNGKFPDADEIAPAQEAFVAERKKGYYNPIVGGVPVISPPAPKLPKGADGKTAAPVVNKTAKVAGRPQGTTGIPVVKASYSRKGIQEVIYEIEKTRSIAKQELKNSLKIKKFNKQQEEMLDKLCEAVVCSSKQEKWNEQLISCVNNFENIETLGILDDILDISSEHQLDNYASAILYHSKLNAAE
jgi:hypothetical protein